MRFAFVSTMHGAPWGGSEELWSQAAARLRHEGHEVWASVVYWPRLAERTSSLARDGVKLQTHPSYRARPLHRTWNNITLASRRSYARLRRFRPDLVVISHGNIAEGFDWSRFCRAASIPYALILQCNSEHAWFREEIGEARASYAGARKVYCVSRHNLELLRTQLGESLPNGEVAWNPYNVSTEPAPPWPDGNGVLRLACVARIDPGAKGQDLLIQALAGREWRGRPIELSFFGSGPDQTPLRRLAETLGLKNVHFRGHVGDIRAIWKEHHMLVLPSRFEGLPLALVEAMWCARPAVVTDAGGNTELCTEGQTGFVASVASLPSLSAALERAWQGRQDWHRLGQAARTRIENVIPKDPVGLFCEKLRTCVK